MTFMAVISLLPKWQSHFITHIWLFSQPYVIPSQSERSPRCGSLFAICQLANRFVKD